jgi:hypothetical protein
MYTCLCGASVFNKSAIFSKYISPTNKALPKSEIKPDFCIAAENLFKLTF